MKDIYNKSLEALLSNVHPMKDELNFLNDLMDDFLSDEDLLIKYIFGDENIKNKNKSE